MLSSKRLTDYRRRGLPAGPRTTQDRDTVGLIGAISAVAGFFVLGIALGPAAMLCGWVALRGRWRDGRPLTAVVALFLGAVDTLLALLWLSGTSPGGGAL
ncbi:small hydrophobic protein [Streptomyces polyrhachis]|uniref:Small hydrophobic protein n=1 Tax=Streptomyces polyrhachis TaxID=1282885 RepID=A0ABW2GCH5_9ACTN